MTARPRRRALLRTIEALTEERETLIDRVVDLALEVEGSRASVDYNNEAGRLVLAERDAAIARVSGLIEANNREVERRRTAEQSVEVLEDELRDLCGVEEQYRSNYERYGDGSLHTRRAWDAMHRAGDRARRLLSSARSGGLVMSKDSLSHVIADALEILPEVLHHREKELGEECEVLRDLIDRMRVLAAAPPPPADSRVVELEAEAEDV